VKPESAKPNHDTLLQEGLASVTQAISSRQCRAEILAPQGNQLFILASTRPEEIGQSVLIDDSVSGQAYVRQHRIIVSDVNNEPRYKNLLGDGIRSEIAVPLPDEQGIINVESPLPDAFTEEDAVALEAHGRAIAEAIPGAFISLEFDIVLQSILEIHQKPSDTPSGDIYSAICRKAQQLIGAEHIQLLLVDNDDEHLEIAFSSSPTDVKRVLISDSVCGQAVLEKSNLYIDDVSKVKKYKPTIPGMKSELVAVAREGNKVFAALNAESSRLDGFTKRDAIFLTLFAHQVVRILHYIQFIATIKRIETEKQEVETMATITGTLANMAHDLQGDTRLIEMELKEIRGSLENSKDEAVLKGLAQIERLVAKFLGTPVLFKQRITEEITTLDLNEVVTRTVEELREEMLVGRTDIVLESASSAEQILVRASRYGLEALIWNLVRNSIEAVSSAGKIQVCTSIVKTKRGGSFAELKVTDNGKGIDPDVIPRIFDPGFSTKKAEPAGQLRGEGMGFGLFWAKFYVERKFKGEISVKSKKGKTEFTIRLPMVTSTQLG